MPINYSIAAMKNPQDPDGVKEFYAKAQAAGESTIDTLAEEISYASTLTDGDVLNVIRALVKVIIRHLKDGRIVRLENLGSFQLQISSKGAETAESFTPSAHIRGVTLQFRPGLKLREALQKGNLTFNVVPKVKDMAKLIKAEKAGNSTVDLTDDEDAPL